MNASLDFVVMSRKRAVWKSILKAKQGFFFFFTYYSVILHLIFQTLFLTSHVRQFYDTLKIVSAFSLNCWTDILKQVQIASMSWVQTAVLSCGKQI